MKKLCILLLCISLLGCEKKESTVSLEKDSTQYSVATPYKPSIANYALTSYDKENVEFLLTHVSQKYYKTNNSLLEEGQYLTNDLLKEWITSLNDIGEVKYDNITFKPQYITTIYEQNYLATNGNLKGLSLAIVLNPKQTYENNERILSKVIDNETVINFGKESANKLIKMLREKDEFKNINIVIGLYLEGTSYTSGKMAYVGQSDNTNIKLDNIDLRYELMDSSHVMEQDIDHYNRILAIKNALNNPKLYISSKGLYEGNTLKEVSIVITSTTLKQSEIISYSDIIVKEINNFNKDIDIKVYFKSNNKIKALLETNKLTFLEG